LYWDDIGEKHFVGPEMLKDMKDNFYYPEEDVNNSKSTKEQCRQTPPPIGI
jgi:hypothetical protein